MVWMYQLSLFSPELPRCRSGFLLGCLDGCTSGLAVRTLLPGHTWLSLPQGLSSPQGFIPAWAGKPGGGNAPGNAAGSQTMKWICLGSNNLNLGPRNSSSLRLSLMAFPVIHDSSALTLIFFSSFSLCQGEKNELGIFRTGECIRTLSQEN